NLTEQNLTEQNHTIITPLTYIKAQDLIQKIQKNQQIQKQSSLSRFGEKFFYNKNTLNKEILSVPDYYNINVGDMVEIQIFGSENQTFNLRVDNNGNINLLAGPIHVAGISLYQAKELIKHTLKPTYPNSKIIVNVKVNSFIQVALTGYVKAPGIYNLSSLSTIKDLLIAANGFGDIGSMRHVYLKRGNKTIKIIDFYKLIKDGDVVDNTLLQNGDTIYVPRAQILVWLDGAVSTPAIYELKSNETLKDLIGFSGGLLPYAASKDIKITRYIKNTFKKVLFKDIHSNFTFKNGDEVYVYNISQLNQQYVEVYGNIEKPGTYELPRDRLLKTLLSKLAYLKDTYYKYGLIERFDGTIVSFDIKHPANIQVRKKDKIYIFNKYQVLPDLYIKVDGEVVANAGKLRFLNNMTLKDAILNAGLKANFDKNKVKIVRYNDKMQPQTFFVDYQNNANFKLKPYDEITLYKYTDFNPLKPIVIMGEVNAPSIYYYSKNMTLKDAIDMAGGFTYKADKNYIELIRYKIINNQRTRFIKRLSFYTDGNIKIQPYDELNIKLIPNWTERKTVTIKGEVKYPGIYTIKTGEKLASVIKRAGGFTKSAYLYATVFTRESVRKMQERQLQEMIYKLKKKVAIISASAKGAGEQSLDVKNLMTSIDTLADQAEKIKPIGRIALQMERNITKFAKSPYNIALENNDTIYIPTKPNSVTVLGEVLTPSAFVYTTPNALDYIKQAGGPTEMADNIFFVVHANGFTQKGEINDWFSKDIEVKPGDAVTIPILIKTSTWYGIAKDITSIIYQLSITAASLKTVGAL
ncbi:MAG: hypothetical protein GXO40_05050, partial [Epsilonproteobacteria bacterium]|nr:hypothetical protein [Campylobacterota bacterium]